MPRGVSSDPSHPLPGLQEAVPPASGRARTAEHHPAGGPAPALEAATQTAGEAFATLEVRPLPHCR